LLKTQTWIEGVTIIALSCVALAEAARLIVFRDPNALYDPLGPGWYIAAIASCTLLSGIVYLLAHRGRGEASPQDAKGDGRTDFRVAATIALSFLYAGSILVVGYVLSTAIFLAVQFRVLGVRSWLVAASASIVVTAALWLVFVRYAEIVFPAGRLGFM
jgi:hypothetical protein